MAVQYASVQSTNFATSTTVTITKPTSLAVGDLMLAHIVYNRAQVLTPFTGWKDLAGTVDLATTLNEGVGGNHKASVQWKIADAGDVAASDFTWTIDGSNKIGGSIFRIIGQAITTPIAAYSAVVTLDSASPSFTGITPTVANSLLLMLVTNSDGSAGSGYAIATSDPTWTERYDNASGGVRAGATASRPEVTATGNATWTVAGAVGSADSTGFLIAISPEPDPVLTPSAITVTVNVPAPSLSVPYSASPDAITVTVSIPSPTLTSTNGIWVNDGKSSSPWVNQEKS